MATIPSRKVSKSTMSMYLRTRCDKELFLSIHDKKTMSAAGLPEPVKRPGIGLLSVDGRAFELERNDQLVRLFGASVHFNRNGESYCNLDLEQTLRSIDQAPAILLQAQFSIVGHKDHTLANIGLSPDEIAGVPDIADFIPDVLVVRSARIDDMEIQPDGTRTPILAANRMRFAIDIIDVKHTSEANPSYCAEIAMYALMLSNWLAERPFLQSRFFVTSRAYLWTRFKQGNSQLDKLEGLGGATVPDLLLALVNDSEDANLRFYLPSVRRFWQDVVNVIRTADAGPSAWADLEWHVCGSCANCDWLGDKRHLGRTEQEIVDRNPTHYCLPYARNSGHLSLVPGITRGAKKVLQNNALKSASALVNAVGHPALQEHTSLKRDARTLPARAEAILTSTLSTDPSAAIASLAGYPNLQIFASINFDSSSGLLTGMALSGFATAYTQGQPPLNFQALPLIVDEKTLSAEWVALEAFLTYIADCINRAEQLAPNPTGQIHFWEERQFQELCHAMGRHLPSVLALADRKAKALAWVFPPDELMSVPESLQASTVVTIDDIVRRMVFTPTPHVITLFDTAESYGSGYAQPVRDPYYREYLSNGIPRERIYELWSHSSPIKRGSRLLPRNTVIAEYAQALSKQSKALESICRRLRDDYKGQLKANAPRISSTIPQGATGVAFDAKIWIWWDRLDFNASQLQAHIKMAFDGERLEASYEAVLLTNGRQLAVRLYAFDVFPSSLEAKFKEGSQLTLGKIGRPGLALECAARIIRRNAPPFQGERDLLQRPLWSLLSAKLVRFNRVSATAEVQFECSADQSFVDYLLRYSEMSLLNDVFLAESKKPSAFDWSKTSSKILKEVGNPSIAAPDQNAANAMGVTPSKRGRGQSPVTPISRVLWEGPALEQVARITRAEASAVAEYAAAKDGLNQSQFAAVEHGAERALTLIWGPPGTGKTNTLAALIHGLAQDAATTSRSMVILVTGPTYKAVEGVMQRTADFIKVDVSASCQMFMGYSRGRAFGPMPEDLLPHVAYTRFTFEDSDTDFQLCRQGLGGGRGVVIVGAQIRQARRLSESPQHEVVQPIFDVVLIDESSQVPVSQALSAMAGLKTDARLIIAGDHLQMPPITSIDPPADAAYLVGSIQSYLERRFDPSVPACVLETNYRSAEDIVAFARTIGYPSTLEAKWGNTSLHFLALLPEKSRYPATLPWCSAFSDLLHPDNKVVTLLHEDEISSQGNFFEARLVAGVVWMLRQAVSAELAGRSSVTHGAPDARRFWGTCVGIVTPHRAQRALVIRALEQLFHGESDFIDEAVDTVERFQGGERHTIIVTYGVADTDVIGGEEAFLMQLERTNVAVSRSMAKCIVVMPDALAAHIPEDKKALATAHALKNYVDEFCNVRIDTSLDELCGARRAQVRFHR